ncbi:hypothetical protein B296_00049057 [Ensete ventricosum]|uniref:Terpene synthase metal-binding domain-containing protein n=1 Tax=Ensete ventricosum TaxID=4639 RepID=A0A426X4L8_ENSVE|nr:hypothetical protein B296_00049057 [Ensete ventricosum]
MIWLPQRYARRQRNTSQSNISSMSLMSFVLQAELARGDVSKSIQCYMHERNVSEDVAREKLREMIRVDWRALNGDRTSSSPLEEYFKRVAINIPRMAQFLYEYGDGYGLSELQVEEPTWIPSSACRTKDNDTEEILHYVCVALTSCIHPFEVATLAGENPSGLFNLQLQYLRQSDIEPSLAGAKRRK